MKTKKASFVFICNAAAAEASVIGQPGAHLIAPES